MNFSKIVFTSAIALLITTAGFAQGKKKPAPSAKSKPAAAVTQLKPTTLPIDAGVTIGKLPNGFTYYIRNNGLPKGYATLMLVNKVGSILETDAQQGAAHFIEHMAFNGTRDFPKNELTSYLKGRGAAYGTDKSANSSFDETVYQLSLPTDTAAIFENGFKLLAGWAGNITFNAAEIETERAKIIDETGLAGTAENRVEKQSIPVFLKNSRYASRLPVPGADAFKKLNADAIKSFYHDWYRPDLQAIIIVGDVDVKHIEQLIKQNFAALKNPAPEKPRTMYTGAPATATTVNFITDKDFVYDQAQITVTYPQTNVKSTADYMQDLRVNLFNQMLGARISDVINQRSAQLLNAQASYGLFYGRQDAFTITAVTKPGALETGLKAVVTEVERARKFGFTLTELERAKQNALIAVSNAYQGKDNTFSINYISQYVQNFLAGTPITGVDYEYGFYTNNVGKVTLTEVNALATKLITSQNRNIIITVSDAEKPKLPDEATLLSWINNAGKDVAAYVDETDEPFMTKAPVAGKVVTTEPDTIINITRLTLSNGVKVILKPTTFTDNQVLINGYSFGGTSLAANQDVASAMLAEKLIAGSGVGDMTQEQLNKRLSSKQVSMSPYITETTQGITGNSSGADFEYAMQLLHLYFTQPRKDAGVWQDFITQTKTSLVTRATDPTSLVQDSVTTILNNNNPRSLGITLKNINTADLDKAYSFYKDRFSDASAFTFTFTGAFTVENILPFIETYLGSLPSTNKKETYKNLNLYPQPGQINKTFKAGNNDKAAIQLTYSGPYDYKDNNNLQLDALEIILNLRLDSVLKEKDGAFSPGARITYVKIPAERYEVTLFADANPADVEKVTNIMLAEINKLKQNGADAKDIQTFVDNEAKLTQIHFRQNVFWAGYLVGTAQNQEDPHQILAHIGALEQITPQSIKDAANKYLSGNNLIKLALFPQKK